MMVYKAPSFTFGIEEEYLLVDRTTRDVVSDPAREIFEQCAARAESGLVMPGDPEERHQCSSADRHP